MQKTEKRMIIAKTADKHLVGRGSGLPWHSSLDFKLFVQTTMGRPIIVGKNTADGMPVFPLKNRPGCIISSTIPGQLLRGNNGEIRVFPNLISACNALANYSEIYIAGGPTLYKSALKEGMIDTIVMTEFPDGYCDGDVYLDEETVRLMSSENFQLAFRTRYELHKTMAYYPSSWENNMGFAAESMVEPHSLKQNDTPFPWIEFKIFKQAIRAKSAERS